MAYKRISKTQVAYIEHLSKLLGIAPPFWLEGYSQRQAVEVIRKLRKQINKRQVEKGEPDSQIALL